MGKLGDARHAQVFRGALDGMNGSENVVQKFVIASVGFELEEVGLHLPEVFDGFGDEILKQGEIEETYCLWVFLIEREDRFGRSTRASPSPDFVLRAGDVLVVPDNEENVIRFLEAAKLVRLETTPLHRKRWMRDAGIATVLIHPDSRLVGRSLRRSRFRSRYGLNVIALRRRGKLMDDVLDRRLTNGDELLVLGPWDLIGRLQRDSHDFVVLTLPTELLEEAPARRLAPVSILIVIGMVILSALEIVPVVLAVLMASLAAVFTRTMTMSDAYRSINWKA